MQPRARVQLAGRGGREGAASGGAHRSDEQDKKDGGADQASFGSDLQVVVVCVI